MGRPIVNLVGKKFGRLEVISLFKNVDKVLFWECLCDCGNKKILAGGDLKKKGRGTKSCGCYARERSTTHGMTHSRFYNIFATIKSRTSNYEDKKYGGRGIKCEWEKFEYFRDDMYKSYLLHVKRYGEKETTIDRINNDGNYCKENCRWATYREQANNTRNTVFVNYKNKKITLANLARKLGINYATIYYRFFISKKTYAI